MKNQKLYLTLGAVGVLLVAVVAVVALQGKGGNLSGYLGGVTTNLKQVNVNNLTAVNITVNQSSPGGQKLAVSATDSIAKFDLCANGDVSINQIIFDLNSGASMNSSSATAPGFKNLYVYAEGQGLGGSNSVISSSTSQIEVLYKMNDQLPLTISKGNCRSLSVSTDTSSLMKLFPAHDSLLTLSIKSLKANAGVVSNAPISANTLRYSYPIPQ